MLRLLFLAWACSASHSFVSLLASDSYLPGLLATVHSAGVHAPHVPFHVLLVRGRVSSHSVAVLADYSALYHARTLHLAWIDPLDANCTEAAPARFAATFAKLRVLDPASYATFPGRSVYLDADTLVVSDCITDLFSSHRYEPPAFAPEVFVPDNFNTGAFLFVPDDVLVQNLHRHIDAVGLCSSYDGGDQGLLNAFFAHSWTGEDGLVAGWNARHRLASRYNAQIQAALYNPKDWSRLAPSLCLIHFAGAAQKPFLPLPNPATRKQLASSLFLQRYHSAWHKLYGSILLDSKPFVPLSL